VEKFIRQLFMDYTLVIIKFWFENLAVIFNFPHLKYKINKQSLVICAEVICKIVTKNNRVHWSCRKVKKTCYNFKWHCQISRVFFQFFDIRESLAENIHSKTKSIVLSILKLNSDWFSFFIYSSAQQYFFWPKCISPT
jgi:hypothetical protein